MMSPVLMYLSDRVDIAVSVGFNSLVINFYLTQLYSLCFELIDFKLHHSQ